MVKTILLLIGLFSVLTTSWAPFFGFSRFIRYYNRQRRLSFIKNINILKKTIISEKHEFAKCLDGSRAVYFRKESFGRSLNNCRDIKKYLKHFLPNIDIDSLSKQDRHNLENEYENKCNEQKDRFAIYIAGGGFCLSQETCRDAVAETTGCLGSSNDDKCAMEEEGRVIYSSNCHLNADFCLSNKIYIPYCTQDLFTGTRESGLTIPSNSQLGLSTTPLNASEFQSFYFAGQNNIEATVQDLIDNDDMDHASEVLFGGYSAGGYGVINTIDDIAAQLQDVSTIKGLVSSGMFFPRHNINIFKTFEEKDFPYDLATFLAVLITVQTNPNTTQAMTGDAIFNTNRGNLDGNALLDLIYLGSLYKNNSSDNIGNDFSVSVQSLLVNTPIFYAGYTQDRLSIPTAGGLNNPFIRNAVNFKPLSDPLRTWGEISFIPPIKGPEKIATLAFINYWSVQENILYNTIAEAKPNNGHFLIRCFNHTFGAEVGDQTVSYVGTGITDPVTVGLNENKKRFGGNNTEVLIINSNGIALSLNTVFTDWFFNRDSTNENKYPNGYFVSDNMNLCESGDPLSCNPTCNLPLNELKFV